MPRPTPPPHISLLLHIASLVLHFCFTVASLFLHCCFTFPSLFLHFCFTFPSLFHLCFTFASLFLHFSFTFAFVLHFCFTFPSLLRFCSSLVRRDEIRCGYIRVLFHLLGLCCFGSGGFDESQAPPSGRASVFVGPPGNGRDGFGRV